MQTKLEKRDIELENLVGNLLIGQYQVERLKERVSQNLNTVDRIKISQNLFKYKNNWYRITINVDQVDLDDKNSE
jgi:cobalamin biosynthesis Co2+ chelatase CbiK